MSRRRGETLVEIVVSFALLSLVLIGISGLVSSLVAMVIDARTVTEATVLAQKGLSDGLAINDSRCDIRDEAGAGYLPHVLIPENPSDKLQLTVTLESLMDEEQVEDPLLPVGPPDPAKLKLTATNGFRKVVSVVHWTDKTNADRYYSLVQVVKR